jgi:hypothetical protein
MTGLVTVVIFILLVIATAVINKIMDNPITWALARLLGGVGPHRSPSVRGLWRSAYDYQNPNGRQHVEQIVQLRQFGPYVMGKALATSKGMHKHRIRGRLGDRILTGTWENVAQGTYHHGAMQLLVRPDGNVMTGQWIGFDRRNRIQHGEFSWVLLTRSLDKESSQKYLQSLP